MEPRTELLYRIISFTQDDTFYRTLMDLGLDKQDSRIENTIPEQVEAIKGVPYDPNYMQTLWGALT